jgi:hypothetical protein
MRKLASVKSTRWALLLLAAVLMVTAMMPAPSHALICCGYTLHYAYFTDATHTTLVGSCTYNAYCVGDDYCSGTQTNYYTLSETCCPRCSE